MEQSLGHLTVSEITGCKFHIELKCMEIFNFAEESVAENEDLACSVVQGSTEKITSLLALAIFFHLAMPFHECI